MPDELGKEVLVESAKAIDTFELMITQLNDI